MIFKEVLRLKRTGEIVLGVIGAFLYAFFAAIGGVMVWIENNRGQVEEFFKDAAEQDPNVTMPDVNSLLDSMGSSGLLLLIVSIVAIILGIVSIVFIKGNKKPKAAGIILIATAVIFAIIIGFGAIIFGIFYLIAGIMCLVRKPQTVIYE